MKPKLRSDIFELIGQIAIVASLIFVALEVRQANLATRIAARDSATQGHMDYMGLLIDSTVLASATAKIAANQELDPIEAVQATIFHEIRWRHYERVFYLYQNDVISDQEWLAYRNGIMQSFTGDSEIWRLSRRSWAQDKHKLSYDFVAYVDGLIEEVKAIQD